MSAQAESLNSLATTKLMLRRNVAKITVTETSDTPTSFESALWGAALSGTLTAGITDHLTASPETPALTTPAALNPDNGMYSPIYIYPTINNGNTFLIVKASFNNNDYYYRIDFNNESGRLNLKANHWYEVIVGEINGTGFDTPDEAAKHPSSGINATIYDHAPDVYDMISDGIRELGVTDIINYTGTPNAEGIYSEKILTIKYYSAVADEMKKAPEVKSKDGWLAISDPAISDGDGSGTPGKIATYRLRFKTTDALGSLKGKITTFWRGLDRETVVNWTRAFNGNNVSEATLTIKNGSNSTDATINTYWDFLAGKGTLGSKTGDTPKLFGISSDKMGGKTRNEGFHFPVMYGKKGQEWSYEYNITMKLADEEDFSWSLTFDSKCDNVIKNNVTISPESGNHKKGNSDVSFKLTCPATAGGYTYGTGKLILTITPTEQSQATSKRYEFGLYHTGFFHFDTGNHRTDSHETGYYYYEVLPITIETSSEIRYILDRNLGAKAAGMYIQKSDGTSHIGAGAAWPFNCEEESAGGYYKVAVYNDKKYEDPAIFDDEEYVNGTIQTRVSPPGYRVPQQDVWDALRNSSKFITRQLSANNISYFSSFYVSTVKENGVSRNDTIYFPKSRYLDGTNQNGETNTGYYWTKTPAAGTEKDEIGKWLKSLQINGSSSTYINGNITDYSMSLRCVNDITDEKSVKVTAFNVNGATHVFLYSGNISDGKYMSTWPGIPIGNHSTMETGWFNFVYESTSYSADDLKVIFNFVESTGEIKTISKNQKSSLKEAEGWDATEFKNKWVKCDRHTGTRIVTSTKP